MDSEKKTNLKRKLQITTLWPLIIGILIATTVVVALLFDKHKSWLYDMRDQLLIRQDQSLKEISKARENRVEAYLSNVRDK